MPATTTDLLPQLELLLQLPAQLLFLPLALPVRQEVRGSGGVLPEQAARLPGLGPRLLVRVACWCLLQGQGGISDGSQRQHTQVRAAVLMAAPCLLQPAVDTGQGSSRWGARGRGSRSGPRC